MPQPFAWWLVVSRAQRLTGDQKVVWDVLRRHDNPKSGDGCWMTTAAIAAEAGVPVRSCEDILQALTRHRLVVTHRRGNRFHREVRLPEQCYPTDRPSRREIEVYGTLLDQAIADDSTEKRLGGVRETC